MCLRNPSVSLNTFVFSFASGGGVEQDRPARSTGADRTDYGSPQAAHGTHTVSTTTVCLFFDGGRLVLILLLVDIFWRFILQPKNVDFFCSFGLIRLIRLTHLEDGLIYRKLYIKE